MPAGTGPIPYAAPAPIAAAAPPIPYLEPAPLADNPATPGDESEIWQVLMESAQAALKFYDLGSHPGSIYVHDTHAVDAIRAIHADIAAIAGGKAPAGPAPSGTPPKPSPGTPGGGKPKSPGYGYAAEAVQAATGTGGNAIQYIAATVAALGPVGVAAAAAALGLYAVSSAANSAAERYGGFSPNIMAAEANASIRELMGDIRRAQMLGPELGKFIDAKSRLSEGWENVKAEFLKKVVPALTEIVNFLAELMAGTNALGAGLKAANDWVHDRLKELGKSVPFIKTLVENMEAHLKKIANKTDEDFDPRWLDLLRDLKAPVQPVQQPPFIDNRLNMPVFGN